MVSISIFLLFLGVLLPLWSHMQGSMGEQNRQVFMENKIVIVSEILSKTEGSPKNWNKTNVKSIGLLTGENLNKTKVDTLMRINYSKSKEILGLNGFDFYLNITDYKNNNFKVNGNNMVYGKFPNNSEYISRIQRLMTYNETVAVLELILWR